MWALSLLVRDHIRVNHWDVRSAQCTGAQLSLISFYVLFFLVFYFSAVTPASHLYVLVLNVCRGGRLRTDADVQSVLSVMPVLPLWSTSNCIFLEETTVGWKQVALEMNCDLKCNEGTRQNGQNFFLLHILHKGCEFSVSFKGLRYWYIVYIDIYIIKAFQRSDFLTLSLFFFFYLHL